MNTTHLTVLKSIGGNDPNYKGNNTFSWSKFVAPGLKLNDELDMQFDREFLFDYCKRDKNSDMEILVAILSWGGMRRDHGKQLLANPNSVLEIVSRLRKGEFSTREEAFHEIQKLRNKGLLPGMGIGYFTKLICFLAPQLNGYIMDQWVGKSVNLISGSNIVSITSNSWVNDKNDCKTYESFCTVIDRIGQELDCTGFEAERRLFSIGKDKGQWRKYVKSNWKR
jgi:hypothetical protein